MTEDTKAPKYIEDLSCRETFGETVQALHGPAGTIKLEFCVFRWTQGPQVYADRIVPTSRVVMTVATARVLRDMLSERLEQIDKAGAADALTEAQPASQLKN
jgi:hypothetical protein